MGDRIRDRTGTKAKGSGIGPLHYVAIRAGLPFSGLRPAGASENQTVEVIQFSRKGNHMTTNEPHASATGHATYSVSEVAEDLGVGVGKIKHWIATGELRAINVSCNDKPRWRIPASAIGELCEKRSNVKGEQT